MKLSKESQFYRFFTKYGCSPPNNLCTLFWGTLALSACLIALGALVGIYIVLGIAAHVLWFQYGFIFNQITVFGFLFDIVLLSCVITIYVKWNPKHLQKTENILDAYIDSIKNKYCPTIDWE
jgi:hypothetical protein